MKKIEAYIRQLIMRALKGDAKSQAALILLCRASGLLTPEPRAEEQQGGVLLLPRALIPEEWEEQYGNKQGPENLKM